MGEGVDHLVRKGRYDLDLSCANPTHSFGYDLLWADPSNRWQRGEVETDLVKEFGGGGARPHGGDRDPAPLQFTGKCFREDVHLGLVGSVGAPCRPGSHRGNVDYGAVVARLHSARCSLG